MKQKVSEGVDTFQSVAPLLAHMSTKLQDLHSGPSNLSMLHTIASTFKICVEKEIAMGQTSA